MANKYNFTIENYNGTDYDTLYPETNSGQVLLDKAAQTATGLASGKTVSDALAQITEDGGAFQVGDTLTTVRTNLGDKWLLCNGASVDASLYPDLNQMIMTDPTKASSYRDITKTAQTTKGYRAKKLNGKYFITGTPLQYADDYAGTWVNTSVNATDICFFDNKYVVVDGTTTLRYSEDLTNWQTVTLQAACNYLANTSSHIAASNMIWFSGYGSGIVSPKGNDISYVSTTIAGLASASAISDIGGVQECDGMLFGFAYATSTSESGGYHYVTTYGTVYKYDVGTSAFVQVMSQTEVSPRSQYGTESSGQFTLAAPYVTKVNDTYCFFMGSWAKLSGIASNNLTSFTTPVNMTSFSKWDSAAFNPYVYYVTIGNYVFVYPIGSSGTGGTYYSVCQPAGGELHRSSGTTDTIGLSSIGYGESAFALFAKDASTIHVMDVKNLPTVSQTGLYTYIKAKK